MIKQCDLNVVFLFFSFFVFQLIFLSTVFYTVYMKSGHYFIHRFNKLNTNSDL